MKSAIWFITWACNNNCPYCWERQRQKRGEFTPEPFLDYRLWVKAWNKITPDILDITGGEPFLQPDFLSLIKELDSKIRIAITTNLKADMTQFVQEIDPQKVFSMTLSLHPSQDNLLSFIGKCLMLQNRGFRIVVNFVAYPEQIWLIPELKEYFNKNNILFHVDPYSQTPYFPYALSEQERNLLTSFIGIDRKNALTEEVRPVMCSAGADHITVYPDGTAFRCINDSINKLPALGNIFKDGFKLNTDYTPCANYNVCAGCNRDKVKVL